MSMITKETLHRVVDALPESEVDTAARVLEALGTLGAATPLYSAGTAPFDDEPETEAKRAAVAEARAELARGEGTLAAEIYRELGV